MITHTQPIEYPSIEEVNKANRYDICRWWRFLPSPGFAQAGHPNFEEVCAQEKAIMDRISERFKELDGFTPEISKALGW